MRDSAITVIALLLFILAGAICAFLWFDGHRKVMVESNQTIVQELREHRKDSEEWKRKVSRWMTEYEARKREDDGE